MVVFIFQFKVFHFSAFFFWVRPLEQKKTIAFYETLHHFRRLHPPCQKSTYMCLTVCGNKSFLLACGLPTDDQNRSGLVDHRNGSICHLELTDRFYTKMQFRISSESTKPTDFDFSNCVQNEENSLQALINVVCLKYQLVLLEGLPCLFYAGPKSPCRLLSVAIG